MLEQKRGGWRGPRQAQNWIRSLERYAFPRIGRRPVSEVNTADVLEILTPIWHVKAETARAISQRIRSAQEWAIAMDDWAAYLNGKTGRTRRGANSHTRSEVDGNPGYPTQDISATRFVCPRQRLSAPRVTESQPTPVDRL